MTAPRLTSVVSDRSDVELAAVFERVWGARGYETRVRFRGPDVPVEATGKTPEGAKRDLRLRITTTGTVTADKASTSGSGASSPARGRFRAGGGTPRRVRVGEAVTEPGAGETDGNYSVAGRERSGR